MTEDEINAKREELRQTLQTGAARPLWTTDKGKLILEFMNLAVRYTAEGGDLGDKEHFTRYIREHFDSDGLKPHLP